MLEDAGLLFSHGPTDSDPQTDFPAWPHCHIALCPGLLIGPGHHLEVCLLSLLRYCERGSPAPWQPPLCLWCPCWVPVPLGAARPHCSLKISRLDSPCGHIQLLGGMKLLLPSFCIQGKWSTISHWITQGTCSQVLLYRFLAVYLTCLPVIQVRWAAW